MEKWELKYRPKRFDEVVGQGVNTKILESTIADPYHTMIFQGASGCGKTTVARIYGNMLNANILEVNAADNNGVDDMRKVLELVRLAPLSNEFRVIIIDEAHMLSNGAWNSMLKPLEEPNSTTIWIICTTEFNKVPITIRGRAVTFKFYPVKAETIIKRLRIILEAEGKHVEEAILTLIADNCKGQVRDAVKGLQQCVYAEVETEEQFNKLFGIPELSGMRAYIESTFSREPNNGLKVIRQIDADLYDWKCRLEGLLQDIMLTHFGIQPLRVEPKQTEKLLALADTYSPRLFGLFLEKLARITDVKDAKNKLITICLVGVE